jgi:hypothetical protein
MRLRLFLFGIGLLATVGVYGCGGGGGVSLTGKVMNGDKAYSPEQDGDLIIMLEGVEGNKSYSMRAQPDGSFKTDEPKGVAPGKYTVSVNKYPSKAQMEKIKGPPTPVSKETGVTWDVSNSNKSFTLDVSKLKF